MRVPQKFYSQPTKNIAQRLLGAVLVRRWRGRTIAGVICETEAYVGPNDLASHASKGQTPRTKTMFGQPGFWYVYLIYGMHYCLNIVTEQTGYPAAVLIRAVIPITGIYPLTKTNGPGKLCRSFQINKTLNAKPSFGKTASAWIENRGILIPRGRIKKTPRIGVDYAGVYRDKPWRYVVSPIVIQDALRRAKH